MGASAYKLRLPLHWKIHPRFNEKLLTCYVPPNFPNQELPPLPPPDLVDDEEQIATAKIVTKEPERTLAMILDHEYDNNSNVSYLAQQEDGIQKWVKNPDETLWKEFLDKYWASQADAQYNSPLEEP
ncbi:uncharacterized protein ARMOST_22419 [Armillaria ostoyae]|uniref:Uncharacterized protein n=1 Tax=Armillaria ostoyae TaxID=47428 RepID=A0A284SCT1_ARMOS|nr:uncharacterized protein ARMOST_22419 [Armillaria ostoyae]